MNGSDDSKRPIDVQALVDDVIGECRDKPLRVPLIKVTSNYPGFRVYEILATCVLPLLKDPESRTIVYFLLLNPREHLSFESSTGGKVAPPPTQPATMSAPSSLLSTQSTLLSCTGTETNQPEQHRHYTYMFKNILQSIHPKDVLERNFVINMYLGTSQSQISEMTPRQALEFCSNNGVPIPPPDVVRQQFCQPNLSLGSAPAFEVFPEWNRPSPVIPSLSPPADYEGCDINEFTPEFIWAVEDAPKLPREVIELVSRVLSGAMISPSQRERIWCTLKATSVHSFADQCGVTSGSFGTLVNSEPAIAREFLRRLRSCQGRFAAYATGLTKMMRITKEAYDIVEENVPWLPQNVLPEFLHNAIEIVIKEKKPECIRHFCVFVSDGLLKKDVYLPDETLSEMRGLCVELSKFRETAILLAALNDYKR